MPPWLRAVNLDPRLRVAAGLGAEVVRQNHDRYVAEAWRQVGAVLAANALRRRAEFSLAASTRLHRKWIAQVPAADLVTATAPVHARVFVGSGQTVTGRLRQSPLPPSIASVEYRRVTRVRGRLLPAAAAWSAAVGPAVLAARSTAARPLDAAVPLDTIDVLNPPSTVWGTAAAATILARLDPTVNQAGMTAAQVAAPARFDEPARDRRLHHRRPGFGERGDDRHRPGAECGRHEADRQAPAAGRDDDHDHRRSTHRRCSRARCSRTVAPPRSSRRS